MPRRPRPSRSRATSSSTKRIKPEPFLQLLEHLRIIPSSTAANELRETFKELAKEYLDLALLPSRQPNAFSAIKKELPNRLPTLFSLSSSSSRRSSQTKSPQSSKSPESSKSSPQEDDNDDEEKAKQTRTAYLALQSIGRVHLVARWSRATTLKNERRREEQGRFLMKDLFEFEAASEEAEKDEDDAQDVEGLVEKGKSAELPCGDVLELTDDDEDDRSVIKDTLDPEPIPFQKPTQPKPRMHSRMISTPRPCPDAGFELDLDDFPRIVHSPTPQSSPAFSMTLRSTNRRRGVQSAPSRANANCEPKFNFKANKVKVDNGTSKAKARRTISWSSHNLSVTPRSLTPIAISSTPTTRNETPSSGFLPVWKIDSTVTSAGGYQQITSTRRRPLVASTKPNVNVEGASGLAKPREWCSPNENSSMVFPSLAQAKDAGRVGADRSPTIKSTTSSSLASKLAYSQAIPCSPSVSSSTSTSPSAGARVGTEHKILHSFLSTCSPPTGLMHFLPNFIAYGCTSEAHLRSLASFAQEKRREVLRRIVAVRDKMGNTHEAGGNDAAATRSVQHGGSEMDLDLLEDHLERCFGGGYV